MNSTAIIVGSAALAILTAYSVRLWMLEGQALENARRAMLNEFKPMAEPDKAPCREVRYTVSVGEDGIPTSVSLDLPREWESVIRDQVG